MRAILLAGGYGKRLKPITNKIPKCLVKINKIPLLEIWIKKLQKAKINEVLINTHYLSEKVESFIKKKKFKIKIKLTHEKKLLGTAGTMLKNIDFYNGQDGFLIHADNFCEEPLINLIKAHKKSPKKCFITALTFKTDNPSSCGIFKIDKKNIVQKFHEKPKRKKNFGNLANGAVYLLKNDFLNLAKKKFIKTKNFSEDIIPNLKKKIYCYTTNKIFVDIGTKNNYMKVKNFNFRIR
jgi:mannose-1-phosphate guanylyltransferase